MYILLWILFGGIIGWIASLITKNDNNMGILANVIVGVIGSILGGFIASWLGYGTMKTFSIMGAVFSVIGSVIILLLINLVKKR